MDEAPPDIEVREEQDRDREQQTAAQRLRCSTEHGEIAACSLRPTLPLLRFSASTTFDPEGQHAPRRFDVMFLASSPVRGGAARRRARNHRPRLLAVAAWWLRIGDQGLA